MKKLLLLLLLSFAAAALAQEPAIPVSLLSATTASQQRYVGTDAFGWRYTIADNAFRKEKDGVKVEYKTPSLGEIDRVDIQNPLQIVLFYKRFNTVVLLDNQLNEITRINFSNVPQPIIAEAAGLASQNRLWIYDITTQQLGLYDLVQGNFKTITPPFTDTIQYYYNDYNYFYWVDAANKCFMVNLFGKVGYLGTVPDFDNVQLLSPNGLLLKKDNALFYYNMEKQTLNPIAFEQKSFRNFLYADQILTIFTDQEIIQYKITLPK